MERAELIKLVLATGCAEEHGGFVFLCDPKWSAVERAQFDALKSKIENRKATSASNKVGRDRWARRDFSDVAGLAEAGPGSATPATNPAGPAVPPYPSEVFLTPSEISDGWLCVPTGGTSGGVRFARHDEKTLGAAVRGFCAHFSVERVNALGVLPAHHVSGLMARVRCAATGGSYVDGSWKQLEAGEWPWPDVKADSGAWFLSLVPTQLQRLLTNAAAVERLRRFRAVFIGGGPLWPVLAEQAAAARIPVATSYGMTETAAMIAAQRPEDFVAGARDCGAVMPHAAVEIVDDVTGAALPAGETGLVRIAGESVCRGYFPNADAGGSFLTEDLGFFDSRGRLHVVGRRDAVIITGGKKVHPAEVEAVLRASGQFADVAVIGVPDPHWGQIVVACHPAEGISPVPEKVEAALVSLASYKRPKRFVALETWPRNAQGKLSRVALLAAAMMPR